MKVRATVLPLATREIEESALAPASGVRDLVHA